MKGHTRLLLAALIAAVALLLVNFPPNVSGKSSQQKAAQQVQSTEKTVEQTKGTRSRKPKVKPTPDIELEPDEANENDPDRPPFAQGLVNHAEYLRRRQEWVNMKMGVEPGRPFDPMARARAVEQMKAQEDSLASNVKQGLF